MPGPEFSHSSSSQPADATALPAAAKRTLAEERRRFVRLDLSATAYAIDSLGNELGQVMEASGGGLQLCPAAPMARLGLQPGQRLMVTIVEPASNNRFELPVEVTYNRSNSIGLRFL